MNPEQLLVEVAIAIRYRCISTTHRWHVIYYQDRITCVPSYENVPTEIILTVFTEHQIKAGFTDKHWDDIKTKVTEFYKELHK